MRRSTMVIVLLLILFFLFKVLRFQTLAYNFLDMYVFLQMATGWIDGRPFMYDNYWGDHQRIHNYYTMWLLGPLCYQLGAYALFLVQTLLLLLAYTLLNERLARTSTPAWARYGLLAVVLLGPTALWLNDHTHMGWHVELSYLPLSILFALSLTGRGWWPFAAGLALVLVKEDGAVLAATIHLGYLGIMYLKQHPGQPLWRLVTTRRFWFVGLGWGGVFVAGMAWLAYLNRLAEPRLGMALSHIVDNVDTAFFWQQLGREAGTTLLLLLPALCFMGWLVWSLPRAVRRQLLAFYGLGIIGLCALNFVQAIFYYNTSPAGYHLLGLTWPPRFVMLWAFTTAYLTFILLRMPPADRPFPAVPAWLVIGGLLLIQLPTVRISRPDIPGLGETKALLLGRVSPFKESRYVDPANLAQFQCLADRLPPRSDVVAFTDVMPYFQKHYLVWQTGKQYRSADLAVIPVGASPEQQAGLKAMRRPYRTIRLKGYVLYVAADYDQFVQACTLLSNPAPGK